MSQDGVSLKGFLRCLSVRESLANSLGSKLGGRFEFLTCPLKKAAPQTPVDGVPKMRTLTLPTLGPQTLNKGRKRELRKVFTGEELVVAVNMAYDRMSCRCEKEY